MYLNWCTFARRLIFVILIFIYIFWYLYLLDICNQENLYILTLVYVVIPTAENLKREFKNLKFNLKFKNLKRENLS